jgi:hypothetical protein
VESLDTIHFMLKCNALHSYKRQYMVDLQEIFNVNYHIYWKYIREDINILLLLLLLRTLPLNYAYRLYSQIAIYHLVIHVASNLMCIPLLEAYNAFTNATSILTPVGPNVH